MEIQLVEVACLTVAKARILLCVRESELDLEAGAVEVDNIPGGYCGVG